MREEYLIRIHGVMEQDDDRDSVELMTRGSFVCREGSFYITYKETETTGFEGCVTTLRLEPSGRMTMLRKGQASSHLVLQEGVRHVGSYSVYGGSMEIGVYTDRLDCRMAEHGGSIELAYTLDMNTTLMSENELCIEVQPADGEAAEE